MTLGAFYAGRRVLVTGHTGFKGAWLCAWLEQLGAKVSGLALPAEGALNLCTLAGIERRIDATHLDIRDGATLSDAVQRLAPELVFHLAAQSLVRQGYAAPVQTFATNVMGTAHLLEAVRATPSVRAAVIVTSDKCYANAVPGTAWREDDALGGFDPYGASKAAAEMAAAAWRHAFFAEADAPAVATARAGNVIGGGDWAADRLVPDCIAALIAGRPVGLRQPHATRPWQHVLAPLHGYLLLGRALCMQGRACARAWNFGPEAAETWPASRIAEAVAEAWESASAWVHSADALGAEAAALAVDSRLARACLGWSPALALPEALTWTASFYRRQHDGVDTAVLMTEQIGAYCARLATR